LRLTSVLEIIDLKEKIENRRIVRNSKVNQSKIRMGEQVKHIEYGCKMTGKRPVLILIISFVPDS